jgi:drug/metabolite transporter (DMT)-like permease
MTPSTFLIVLCAAALHASWNAAVKGGSDKRLQMAAVTIGHMPFAAIALIFVPPLDFAAWPFLILGAVFHFGYQVFLIQSYKLGDLSQVYPIARASAPMMATVFGLSFLGVDLTQTELLGIAVIAIGLVSTVGLRIQNVPRKAALSALITGVFITAYSLSDGYGGRVGNSPIAFYGWLSLLNGVFMAIYLARSAPASVPLVWTRARVTFIGGGFASFAAYSLVMYAFSVAPIPVVMAIRESSIIIAFLIGIVVLGEKLTWAKAIGTVITLCGIFILRLGG